jgi:hypothetical protein
MPRAINLRPSSRLVAGIVVSGAFVLTSPGIGLAQWIHIDPQTGRRVAPSAPVAAMAVDPAFGTSQQGLVELAAPGGGVKVDLNGRFRSAATATVGADGKVAVDCVAPGAAARDVKP